MRSLIERVSRQTARHGLYAGRRSTRVHVALYRSSGGRLGARLPGRRPVPILLLDHRGARSGRPRTSPLMYHRDGGDFVVVASKAGQPTHPAWFHNLVADPDTTVQVGSVVRAVRARVATDAERERLWPRLVAMFGVYEDFQRYAGSRTLPVVILEPRE